MIGPILLLPVGASQPALYQYKVPICRCHTSIKYISVGAIPIDARTHTHTHTHTHTCELLAIGAIPTAATPIAASDSVEALDTVVRLSVHEQMNTAAL